MYDFALVFVGFLVGALLAYVLSVMAAAADCRACRQRMTADRLRRECAAIDINTLDWWSDGGDAVTWRELQGMLTPRLPKG